VDDSALAPLIQTGKGRRIVFPVEIPIGERDEDALTARMAAIRQWPDHHGFEPTTFDYTFTARGILFWVDFSVEAEAAVFAKEFRGRVVETLAAMSPQAD